MNIPKCCVPECLKDAEFAIYDENERRPGFGETFACEAHVGGLLGSTPPTPSRGPWRVFTVAADVPKS